MACVALAFFCVAPSAMAHEFWLLPERFQVKTGEAVTVNVLVGAGWPGEALPRNPNHALRFDWLDARGAQPMAGEPGDEPAGNFKPTRPGNAWGVYRSGTTTISLPAAQFESYLAEEGLESIIQQRQATGTSQAAGVEVYSRCAKTLLQVGKARSDAAWIKRPVGLTLELVPLQDPRRTRAPSQYTPMQLLLEGKPLVGALVRVLRQQAGAAQERVRTDAKGIARLKLQGTGVFLINAVHMRPARVPGTDWESIWSSLTFEKL